MKRPSANRYARSAARESRRADPAPPAAASATGSPPAPSSIAQLQRAVGNRAVSGLLHAKVGEATREREADRMADAALQRDRAAPDAPHSPPGLACAARGVAHEPASPGSGSALPSHVRTDMELRFGTDFRSVRVHTDATAARTARAIDAQAFTVGRDIVFDSGKYAPETSAGKHLIAHELAHVVQQRSTGPSLQRKESEAPAAGAASIGLDLGKFHVEITTHEQLLAASRLLVDAIQRDLADLDGDSPTKTAANEWITYVQAWQPYLEQHRSEPLSPTTVKLARDALADAGKIRSRLYVEKDEIKQAEVRRHLREVRKQAEDAAEEAERMKPRLADGLRAAFRKEKPSHIKEWVEMIGSATAMGTDMHELAENLTEALIESEHVAAETRRMLILDPLSTNPTAVIMEIEPAIKLAEAVRYLNKGLAIVNLAFIVTDTEKRATEAEEGMKQLGHATEAFGAFTVLFELSPHIGLLTHLYIVPMTKAIMVMLSRLIDQLHEENKDWVALTGQFGREGAEPGSRKLNSNVLLRFMISVMRADSAEQIPMVTSAIADYFIDHGEAFDAGAYEEMPTTGWWWWRSLDSKKGREWLFQNRSRIWAMLYGSMEVPP